MNYLPSNMTFHDTSSWYHVAVVTDVTQASATDRVKAFINGINLDEDGSTAPWGKNTRLVQSDGGSAINTDSRHYVGAASDATATDAGAGFNPRYYHACSGGSEEPPHPLRRRAPRPARCIASAHSTHAATRAHAAFGVVLYSAEGVVDLKFLSQPAPKKVAPTLNDPWTHR